MNKPLTIPPETLRQQYASSDPNVSAWVSANAGSGKTHVLTQRVIRLMLAGNAPDRILCLTFTKAAAANMKNRVFDTLSKWTMLSDAELDIEISKLTGQHPKAKERRTARSLFARALDTPGGLKIQTIHAFCESLLRQFPLEANVPGHFEVLQEAAETELLERAKSFVLAGKSEDGDVLKHYTALNGIVSPASIETAIAEVISKRSEFQNWAVNGIEEPLSAVKKSFGLEVADDENSILMRGFTKLYPLEEKLKSLAALCGESNKPTDQERAQSLKQFLSSDDLKVRFDGICNTVFTKDGNPRSEARILTKFVKDTMPDAVDTLLKCAGLIEEIKNDLSSLKIVDLSRHLFSIADSVLERFEALKRVRGVIDYNDQIEKCATLLTRSNIRDWIRYRLDRGIDHMLVDEAQDTSPRQWSIINAITSDFNVGETAARRARSIFVVGDEKQSIYSFQGAEPQEFARQERQLKKAVEAADKPYHPGSLSLSFRSTEDVLLAVDRVFSFEENRLGLTQSGEKPIHNAIRSNDPGEVQVWPLFSKSQNEEARDWLEPVDQEGNDDPAKLLAERITKSIGEWVGKPLPGSAEPLKFGDILVLVRKRDRFITALTRTMKDAGLEVAGADRIVLTEHVAVEDLLALGQFVLMPRDDLNLACLLKSVPFALDEETLFSLAHGREGTLYSQLLLAAEAEENPANKIAKNIVDDLALVQKKSRTLDVFEFFTWVLGPFGARKAFLARLGMEAEDVLDAFLEQALSFTKDGGMGLENFIAGIKRAKPEIKREVELDRDEVRILTTHASKGLEAKVVFLVDPCNAPWTEKHRPSIMNISPDDSGSLVWVPSKEFHNNITRQATEDIGNAAMGEYRRLLYVGMTRAADRLVVCGYRGINVPSYSHWHSMVESALVEGGTEYFDEDGQRTNLIWHSKPDRSAVEFQVAEKPDSSSVSMIAQVPDWATTTAKYEAPLPAPLSPAGAHAMIEDEDFNLAKTDKFSDAGNRTAILRGNVIHKLLEALPDLDTAQWKETAKSYLQRQASELTQVEQEAIWKDVQTILTAPGYAELFSSPSRAEVSIAGKLETNSGVRLISGQIDRLVTLGDRIVILDYKTGKFVPQTPTLIPGSYLTQLSLYRQMVQAIYPDKIVECALLWTSKPEMMSVPNILLDEALEKIKNM